MNVDNSYLLKKSLLKNPLLCLAGSCLFLLHQVEEGEGEDEGRESGGRALAVQESDWCDALVVMMNLLRRIRCRDRVSSSGVVRRTLAPIGSNDLAPGCLSF